MWFSKKTDGPEDELEFSNLVERNKGIVFKVVNSFYTQWAEKEDLAQEILIQVWRSKDSYNPSYKETTWIYRIALNVAISFQRKRDKFSREYTTDQEQLIEWGEAQPAISESSEQLNDEIHQLYGVIQQLNAVDKAIILLFLEGESYRAIGEILGLSETNVATKLGRIKNKIKDKMSVQEIN